jgi:hypothetical protein
MKWVAGMMALVAIGSGCASLNQGSDQVALQAPGKATTDKRAVDSPAVVPTEIVAAPTPKQRTRDGSRPESDRIAEVSVTALPPSADMPERTSTRVVRGSPPEMPRPRPAVPANEPAPVVSETKNSEPLVSTNSAAVAPAPSDPKLPTIVNGSAEPAQPPAGAAEPAVIRPTATAVRMVNSKRVSLNYEIKDVGPSGISAVELWYTQDGKKWEKYDTTSQPRPPFVVELKDEGLYGFTLVARNGVGLGKRPPRSGDQPQVWVEVDTTKPVVKLLDTQVGVSGEGQHLSIHWRATDNNLGQRPITLSYAEQPVGPWTLIAANVENTGTYLWQLPLSIPPRFVLRVEAADLVGNVGMAQMAEPILLDLSQPTVSIVAVEPALK